MGNPPLKISRKQELLNLLNNNNGLSQCLQKIRMDELCIFVDMRKINDAFLQHLFPTPFIDEVLDSVGGGVLGFIIRP